MNCVHYVCLRFNGNFTKPRMVTTRAGSSGGFFAVMKTSLSGHTVSDQGTYGFKVHSSVVTLSKDFHKYHKIPQLSIFACTTHLVIPLVISPVLWCNNAVVSGSAADECTLWKWAWLVKNCAQAKELELSYFINPPSLP